MKTYRVLSAAVALATLALTFGALSTEGVPEGGPVGQVTELDLAQQAETNDDTFEENTAH